MKTTAVLLKVTGEPGKAWWESLGLPPPWKWGDDQSFAYVVREQRLEASSAEARAAA